MDPEREKEIRAWLDEPCNDYDFASFFRRVIPELLAEIDRLNTLQSVMVNALKINLGMLPRIQEERDQLRENYCTLSAKYNEVADRNVILGEKLAVAVAALNVIRLDGAFNDPRKWRANKEAIEALSKINATTTPTS